MPVRYVPMTSPAPKEFVEPVAEDYFIYWLFHNRCVLCNQPATEIVPISHSKKLALDWENEITLCGDCLKEYSRHGVNYLQQKRYDFLMSNDREEYANYVPLVVIVV